MNTENEKAVRDPMQAFTTALFLLKCYRGEIACDKKRPNDLRETDAAIANMEAALQSQVSNTDGWVRVPVEPTQAMHDSWMYGKGPWSERYSAMLASAPKAPQQVSNTTQDDLIALHGDGVLDSVSEEFRLQCVQQEQSGEAVKVSERHDTKTYLMRVITEAMREATGFHAVNKAEVRAIASALMRDTTVLRKLIEASPTTPTATAPQESAPGQVAVRFIDVWKKYMPSPLPEEMQTYHWCETFWKEGRKSIAPPTSTAIAAATVLRCVKQVERYLPPHAVAQLRALTPAAAEAELEALRRDAERLRFVEDTIGWNVCRYSDVLQCWVASGMYEVDAAINMPNGEGK